MPDSEHEMFEGYLRKFLKHKFDNYDDMQSYDLLGNWSNTLTATINQRFFRGSIPDLAIISKKGPKIVCIGEAKRINDFNSKRLDFLPRSKIQLNEYIDWFFENKDSYDHLQLVYSVPRIVKATTRNILHDIIRKRRLSLELNIISKWPISNEY